MGANASVTVDIPALKGSRTVSLVLELVGFGPRDLREGLLCGGTTLGELCLEASPLGAKPEQLQCRIACLRVLLERHASGVGGIARGFRRAKHPTNGEEAQHGHEGHGRTHGHFFLRARGGHTTGNNKLS